MRSPRAKREVGSDGPRRDGRAVKVASACGSAQPGRGRFGDTEGREPEEEPLAHRQEERSTLRVHGAHSINRLSAVDHQVKDGGGGGGGGGEQENKTVNENENEGRRGEARRGGR